MQQYNPILCFFWREKIKTFKAFYKKNSKTLYINWIYCVMLFLMKMLFILFCLKNLKVLNNFNICFLHFYFSGLII